MLKVSRSSRSNQIRWSETTKTDHLSTYVHLCALQCLYVFACACTCMQYLYLQNIKIQRHRCECRRRHNRFAILRSRDYMKAMQNACARGPGNMYARAYAHSYQQIDTRTHDTDKSRAIHQHAQTRLPWFLWTMFLVFLIDMLPNSCNGACANVHTQFRHYTNPV